MATIDDDMLKLHAIVTGQVKARVAIGQAEYDAFRAVMTNLEEIAPATFLAYSAWLQARGEAAAARRPSE